MKDTAEHLTVLREMLESADYFYHHWLYCAERADTDYWRKWYEEKGEAEGKHRAALSAAIKAMEENVKLRERFLNYHIWIRQHRFTKYADGTNPEEMETADVALYANTIDKNTPSTDKEKG